MALHIQTSWGELPALECPRSTLPPTAPPFPNPTFPPSQAQTPPPLGGLVQPASAPWLEDPDPMLFQSLHWHLSASQAELIFLNVQGNRSLCVP